jgi:acetyltransferase-like isoleucine patch superfamily enzyme
MTDVLGRIVIRTRNARLMLLEIYSKVVMFFLLAFWGIKTGRRVRFFGITYMVRHPNSVIQIGDGSTFRSSFISNLIGVNRHCLLSTHSKLAKIIIGKNCGFSGSVIGAKVGITIGNDVLCGANTLITDFDWHGIPPDQRRTSTGQSKEIIIENNVFIGYGTVILKGVTIGKNSVIGANSVVSKNIPENVIAGGNPCKVIKNL